MSYMQRSIEGSSTGTVQCRMQMGVDVADLDHAPKQLQRVRRSPPSRSREYAARRGFGATLLKF
jgi:hypothetical protein